MLEFAFGYALKMRMILWVVFESKGFVEMNLSKFYDLGKMFVQELNRANWAFVGEPLTRFQNWIKSRNLKFLLLISPNL